MRAFLVTHTHWDREWYRTFQSFRARLVDAVDRVLDLCASDPGYRFLLDGQSVALEDYAAIRPARVAELRARIAEGRIAIGPWYVQPDSLLPAGESHVRNLLEGRRAGEAFGPVSRIGYTPDSFGHPAQFPQLFAGFGIRAFVYWRGHGAEIERLPSEYDWLAPDGTALLACHLGKGYFAAASDPRADVESAAGRIAGVAKELAARTQSGAILLMNGIDHALPEPRTAALAEAAARISGFACRAVAARGLRRCRRGLGRRAPALLGRALRLEQGAPAARRLVDAQLDQAREPRLRDGAARLCRALRGAGCAGRRTRRASGAAPRLAHAAPESRARLDLRLLARRGARRDARALRRRARARARDRRPRARTARGRRRRAARGVVGGARGRRLEPVAPPAQRRRARSDRSASLVDPGAEPGRDHPPLAAARSRGRLVSRGRRPRAPRARRDGPREAAARARRLRSRAGRARRAGLRLEESPAAQGRRAGARGRARGRGRQQRGRRRGRGRAGRGARRRLAGPPLRETELREALRGRGRG